MDANEKQNILEHKDPLIMAIESGHSAIIVTGNTHDLTPVEEEILYRPYFIEFQLYKKGFIVMKSSKSQGTKIFNYSSYSDEQKREIDSNLKTINLYNIIKNDRRNNPDEIRNFFRGISRLLKITNNGKTKFAVIIDYTEHLAPAVQNSAAASEEHIFVIECLHQLANAPSLKKSGNVLICISRDGYYNVLLNDLYKVEYAFPDQNQIQDFVNIIFTRFKQDSSSHYAELDKGLTLQDFARLTRGLRLKDIESMIRECHEKGIIDRKSILEIKAKVIELASEGTLVIMSTQLTLKDIVGFETIKVILNFIVKKLIREDSTSPRAILFTGPPGLAKSTIPPILANMSGFNIVQFQNVKNMYVGESERRMNQALRIAESLAPTILFLDEITETTPSRNQNTADHGTSQDLLGQLFKFSARDDLRGKVLLLAATNVPERLDPAWHDRFVIIPFLELMPKEMVILFGVFQKRLTGENTLNSDDEKLVEASQILHAKGASPRKILDIVNHAILLSDHSQIHADDILNAAKDYIGSTNPIAIAYSSLNAIAMTSFHSFLPWSLDPENYIFPWYLEGIVEKKTGIVDRNELYKRIHEYKNQVSWT